MSTFAVQRGASALCTWQIGGGEVELHERAAVRDGMLLVGEVDKLAFVLSPAPDDLEHRIFIGDVPLSGLVSVPEDEGGVSLGGSLFWRELAYFESARGRTKVILEARPEGGADDEWSTVIVVDVYVVPSKLSEERYEHMSAELQAVSRSLLVDLYGKSQQTHDLRHSREGNVYQSREHELNAIRTVLDQLGEVLGAIARRPASRTAVTAGIGQYWGSERVTPPAVVALSRRGISPKLVERPIRIRSWRRVESFDIPEHRVIQAFLQILHRRAAYCGRVARGHVDAIRSERHLRHVRSSAGPTLYETNDMPRVARLQEALHWAQRSTTITSALSSLPFLQGVPGELTAVRGGAFQRSEEYRAVLRIIRQFLSQNAVWYEGDDFAAITKLTSRLFEQWCFLRVVDAFRKSGVELREWGDALRQNLRSRFVVDFDRGLLFEGDITSSLRLRFRYEPWILGRESAARARETLCRGSTTDVAWCPDVVIECLRHASGEWRPCYAIVLDCKYTARLRSQHWNDTSKYLEIRCTETQRQVVRQLWLVAPSSAAEIRSEDPAVEFKEDGPSCPAGEAVRLRLLVTPCDAGADAGVGAADDPFQQFANGTLAFLRREFGSNGPGGVGA